MNSPPIVLVTSFSFRLALQNVTMLGSETAFLRVKEVVLSIGNTQVAVLIRSARDQSGVPSAESNKEEYGSVPMIMRPAFVAAGAFNIIFISVAHVYAHSAKVLPDEPYRFAMEYAPLRGFMKESFYKY
jgi:hypothetical protein